MLLLSSNFTPIEQSVLSAICEMHSADQVALGAQLMTASLRSRENTGAGFYTRFDVSRHTPAIGGERLRNGPTLKIHGLEHGMGSILWFVDGYANCLEGFSYDESTTGIDLEAAAFELAQSKG